MQYPQRNKHQNQHFHLGFEPKCASSTSLLPLTLPVIKSTNVYEKGNRSSRNPLDKSQSAGKKKNTRIRSISRAPERGAVTGGKASRGWELDRGGEDVRRPRCCRWRKDPSSAESGTHCKLRRRRRTLSLSVFSPSLRSFSFCVSISRFCRGPRDCGACMSERSGGGKRRDADAKRGDEREAKKKN